VLLPACASSVQLRVTFAPGCSPDTVSSVRPPNTTSTRWSRTGFSNATFTVTWPALRARNVTLATGPKAQRTLPSLPPKLPGAATRPSSGRDW